MTGRAAVMPGFAKSIIQASRHTKRLIGMVADFACALLATYLAWYLRMGEWIRPDGWQWLAYALAGLTTIGIFSIGRLYKSVLRYLGGMAFVELAAACAGVALIYGLFVTFIGIPGVPRTLGLIMPLLLCLLAAGWRILVRLWLIGGDEVRTTNTNLLIYGAGRAGRQLATAFADRRHVRVVSFIDDDPTLVGSIIGGVKIHAPQAMPGLIARHDVTEIIFAIPSASRSERRKVIDSLLPLGIEVRVMPGLDALMDDKVSPSDLREVEIEDIMGRDSVPPDPALLAKAVTGRTVLVTGAGGSIGSELCRQLLRQRAARLILVEVNEYNLYTISEELTEANPGGTEIIPLLASVTDRDRMERIFQHWQPATVFHAAAYKHVPIVEHNLIEGVRNNIFGTINTAGAAAAHGTQEFVLISTDKAVRPTNVMGATKRAAELILQDMAARCQSVRFSMVRFGNVLGSSGSVVPVFRRQIRAGGPVTLTHNDMTRYFMSIPEAAELVIQAGAMAEGGDVFVLDMGEPVAIRDLARRMIELSGLTVCDDDNPDGDIEIRAVGMRPGEKLYEELLISDNPIPTRHPRIMRAREKALPPDRLSSLLADLRLRADAGDVAGTRQTLHQIVEQYQPPDHIVDWLAQPPQRQG